MCGKKSKSSALFRNEPVCLAVCTIKNAIGP